MSGIKVLSKELSELIAAGEVIDRPASIVKELLENAIDAGANVVTVEIKCGGRVYIRITDNGCGIAPDDCSVAFLRHATSKIYVKNDLNAISTLGFRGEALASICAVAKVELMTKRADDEFGTRYSIAGSDEKSCETVGCPDGTTFIVRDVFFNVPARLKFLKKDVTEGNKVSEIVTKLALSHPEVSFKYIRDNKTELLTAGDEKIYSVIYSVFGREFANSLIPVDYVHNGIKVSGYTVKPLCGKPNRKFQRFFVNSRYVHADICNRALEEAYQNTIMVGKFPACILYLEVSPETIDVNVHPTKIEVRFTDNAVVREAVYFAIKNSLLKQDKPTQMNLEPKKKYNENNIYVNHEIEKGEQLRFSEKRIESPKASNIQSNTYENRVDSRSEYSQNANVDISDISEHKTEPIRANDDLFLAFLSESLDTVEKVIPCQSVEDIAEAPAAVTPIINDETEEVYRFINNSSFEKKQQVVIVDDDVPEPVKPVVVGELFKTYIVVQAGEDMCLVDKHAAHERCIFERIKRSSHELEIQMLLEPIMVMLAYDEYDALVANLDIAPKFGFSIDNDVAPTVAVKGIPSVLADSNPTDIVTELARNFLEKKHNPQLEIFDEMYHSMACKAAIKANDNSDILELQSLVNEVYNNENIKYCPHGRPVMITLSKKDIEKQFRRIL